MSSKPLYPAYLPTRPEGYAAPVPLPFFEAEEPGRGADPAKAALLKGGASLSSITPRIGTEIRGVQISQLSKEGLDEVALLAAERGVLVFVSSLLLGNEGLSSTKPLCRESKILQISGLKSNAILSSTMARYIITRPWAIPRAQVLSSTSFMLTKQCKWHRVPIWFK